MEHKRYENNKIINPDHVATPKWVVESIYDLIDIKSYNKCWFPFDHYDSQFRKLADELKIDYLATHILDVYGHDFFVTYPPIGTDLMISNPPFSEQNEIIERSFWLVEAGYIKSFALLLPLTTLETEKRASIYDRYKNGLSVVIFKKRIKFIGHIENFTKPCCWICYNIKTLSDKKISWV